jgi:hypothetical protein
LAGLFFFALPVCWLTAERRPSAPPSLVFAEYIKAAYARDFSNAYRLISLQDRRLKTEQVYVRERGSFTGFTLEVTRLLSEFVQSTPVLTQLEGNRARVKLILQYPDANSLSQLLLDWDEDKLNALPRPEQIKILSAVSTLKRQDKINMIEGEEETTLIKEGRSWRVFLDWASGVRVNFDATVPDPAIVEAAPLTKTTLIRRNEPFIIVYRVKNRSQKPVFARIAHHVEPKEIAQYLRLFECGLLLPVRLRPGELGEFTSVYLVHGDLPEGGKELRVHYEFKLES